MVVSFKMPIRLWQVLYKKSVLEFLPLAQHLYEQNQSLEWLDRLETIDKGQCCLYTPSSLNGGLCAEYKYRGLICRLFGFSARKNKYGKKELVTCQTVKSDNESRATKFCLGSSTIFQYPSQVNTTCVYTAPTMTCQTDLPINQAIKRAIELILHYHAYRH